MKSLVMLLLFLAVVCQGLEGIDQSVMSARVIGIEPRLTINSTGMNITQGSDNVLNITFEYANTCNYSNTCNDMNSIACVGGFGRGWAKSSYERLNISLVKNFGCSGPQKMNGTYFNGFRLHSRGETGVCHFEPNCVYPLFEMRQLAPKTPLSLRADHDGVIASFLATVDKSIGMAFPDGTTVFNYVMVGQSGQVRMDSGGRIYFCSTTWNFTVLSHCTFAKDILPGSCKISDKKTKSCIDGKDWPTPIAVTHGASEFKVVVEKPSHLYHYELTLEDVARLNYTFQLDKRDCSSFVVTCSFGEFIGVRMKNPILVTTHDYDEVDDESLPGNFICRTLNKTEKSDDQCHNLCLARASGLCKGDAIYSKWFGKGLMKTCWCTWSLVRPNSEKKFYSTADNVMIPEENCKITETGSLCHIEKAAALSRTLLSVKESRGYIRTNMNCLQASDGVLDCGVSDCDWHGGIGSVHSSGPKGSDIIIERPRSELLEDMTLVIRLDCGARINRMFNVVPSGEDSTSGVYRRVVERKSMCEVESLARMMPSCRAETLVGVVGGTLVVDVVAAYSILVLLFMTLFLMYKLRVFLRWYISTGYDLDMEKVKNECLQDLKTQTASLLESSIEVRSSCSFEWLSRKRQRDTSAALKNYTMALMLMKLTKRTIKEKVRGLKSLINESVEGDKGYEWFSGHLARIGESDLVLKGDSHVRSGSARRAEKNKGGLKGVFSFTKDIKNKLVSKESTKDMETLISDDDEEVEVGRSRIGDGGKQYERRGPTIRHEREVAGRRSRPSSAATLSGDDFLSRLGVGFIADGRSRRVVRFFPVVCVLALLLRGKAAEECTGQTVGVEQSVCAKTNDGTLSCKMDFTADVIIDNVGGTVCLGLFNKTAKEQVGVVTLHYESLVRIWKLSNLYYTGDYRYFTRSDSFCTNKGYPCDYCNGQTKWLNPWGEYAYIDDQRYALPSWSACTNYYVTAFYCFYQGHCQSITVVVDTRESGIHGWVKSPIMGLTETMVVMKVVFQKEGGGALTNITEEVKILGTSGKDSKVGSVNVHGVTNVPSVNFGPKKVFVTESGDTYLTVSSELNTPISGTVGDIQCISKEVYLNPGKVGSSNSTPDKYDVRSSIKIAQDLVTLFAIRDGSHATVLDPGVRGLPARAKEELLPVTFGGNRFSYAKDSDSLLEHILGSRPIQMTVRIAGTFEVKQISTECIPEIEFVSLEGCYACQNPGAEVTVNTRSNNPFDCTIKLASTKDYLRCDNAVLFKSGTWTKTITTCFSSEETVDATLYTEYKVNSSTSVKGKLIPQTMLASIRSSKAPTNYTSFEFGGDWNINWGSIIGWFSLSAFLLAPLLFLLLVPLLFICSPTFAGFLVRVAPSVARLLGKMGPTAHSAMVNASTNLAKEELMHRAKSE